jgi:hypothetical protein
LFATECAPGWCEGLCPNGRQRGCYYRGAARKTREGTLNYLAASQPAAIVTATDKSQSLQSHGCTYGQIDLCALILMSPKSAAIAEPHASTVWPAQEIVPFVLTLLISRERTSIAIKGERGGIALAAHPKPLPRSRTVSAVSGHGSHNCQNGQVLIEGRSPLSRFLTERKGGIRLSHLRR